MDSQLVREVFYYRNYFEDFYKGLDKKTKQKVDWTINLLETLENIPAKYFKHLSGTNGLFEIRVESDSNIYRIFSFFDEGKLIIAINGFHKKTNKTTKSEIEKALKIRKQYFDEKE
jgi:phage-related protein